MALLVQDQSSNPASLGYFELEAKEQIEIDFVVFLTWRRA